MNYTARLKVCIAADIIAFLGFAILLVCHSQIPVGTYLASLFLLLLLWIGAVFYRDFGSYKKWRNIWKDPKWMTVTWLVAGIMIGLFFFEQFDETRMDISIFMLMLALWLGRDIYYLRLANFYDLDSISSATELTALHPESLEMINKKLFEK